MRRRAALGVLATGLAAVPAARACRLFPRDGTEERFVARQDGREIGRRDLAFSRADGALRVLDSVELDFRLWSGVDVRYRHRAVETWRAAQLESLAAHTEISGVRTRVNADRGRDGMVVDTDARSMPLRITGYFVPSSLWHRDSRFVNHLLDATDGRLKLVNPRRIATEKVSALGRTVEAEHYRIRGQIDRDVWYDADCSLVREAMPLRDESWIVLERVA